MYKIFGKLQADVSGANRRQSQRRWVRVDATSSAPQWLQDRDSGRRDER